MQYQIRLEERDLKGSVQLPSSKSVSNRLLILDALGRGRGKLGNLSDSEDTSVLQTALSGSSETIDIGHAGTAMRFLTAYLSIQHGEFLLTGSARMKQRPIGKLVEALQQLGADINYDGDPGFPPLRIRGRVLKGGKVTIDSSVSSQYISALMMIAPVMNQGMEIHLDGEVVSASYIRLTQDLMSDFEIPVEFSGNRIHIPFRTFNSRQMVAEGDWSSAGYWYAMAALAEKAEIELLNLKRNSMQGDAVIPELFQHLGVRTTSTEQGLRIERIRKTTDRFEYNFSNCPDLVQTMVVTCALLGVPFRMTGTKTLRIKETDRILALQVEMKKLGFMLDAHPKGDWIAWDGGSRTTDDLSPDTNTRIEIDTYDDHRMALAFAPASLHFPGLIINDPGVVRKSYPRFWEHLSLLGFEISEI